MNSKIVMAASAAHRDHLENYLETFGKYTKEYKYGEVFYTLNTEWDEEYNQPCRDLAEFLSRTNPDNYAFIRIEGLNAIQINGEPDNFGMSVNLEVNY